MIVSVALCTYNGASFIEEQIRSILNQSRSVDEIVVCDDGSTDTTLQIIEGLKANSDTTIRIYQNETNLGPSRNFQKAIALCKGDIVFLSDQDDVWCENKVQVMVDWFNENPSKNVVFSDADLINEDGDRITEKSLWDCIGFTRKAQIAFQEGLGIELFCYENRATGATMAVRRGFAMASHFADICNDIVLHDGSLAMLALGKNSLGFIPEKLTLYRCHGDQTVGIGATIDHPLSDDPKVTSPMGVIWSKCTLPTDLKQRVEYVATRHRMIAQRMGVFRILKRRCLYKQYYLSNWKSFFHYDITQWKTHAISK